MMNAEILGRIDQQCLAPRQRRKIQTAQACPPEASKLSARMRLILSAQPKIVSCDDSQGDKDENVKAIGTQEMPKHPGNRGAAQRGQQE